MPGAVTIRPAAAHLDFEACVRLQREVWGLCDLEITSVVQLIATVHAGGLLLVAEDGADGVVGFCYAFAAVSGGKPHLHSDMLAVRPQSRGLGLGARLKWAQREAALDRGIGRITWTFDPMQSRNAALNLRRLGAEATELLPNLYGVTTSALHHGLPTDRLLVTWELESDRVRERARGAAPSEPDEVAARINDVTWEGEVPVSSPPRLDLTDEVVALSIPGEWNTLCRRRPDRARVWQAAVARALQAYLGRGYRAVDFEPPDREERLPGRYRLARGR